MYMPPDEPRTKIPDWILTYGDLMSLLLCFFVLIASFSQIRNEEQKTEVIRSILKQFGDVQSLARFDDAQ